MMKKNKLSREELCDILANSDGYLKRILAVIGASPDEQEEIAHQAIFNAYEKLHSLREPEKLLSWLTTVAKRLYNRERIRQVLGAATLRALWQKPTLTSRRARATLIRF